MGNSCTLTARDILYTSFHRKDSTLPHILCYISHGALAGKRNSLKGQIKLDGSANSSHHDQEGKERNVSYNDALNTFYLRLYGTGHMVKDHSDSERGNLLDNSF